MTRDQSPHEGKSRRNPRTEWRHGQHSLTSQQVKQAIVMRDMWKWSFSRIADALRRPEADVRVAINRTRAPDPDHGRFVVNGKEGQRAAFNAFALPGDPAHATLGRLLDVVAALDKAGIRLPGMA